MAKPSGSINKQHPYTYPIHSNVSSIPEVVLNATTLKDEPETKLESSGILTVPKSTQNSALKFITTPTLKHLDINHAEEVVNNLEMLDLRILNKIVVDRINHLLKTNNDKALSRFNVGNKVTFRTKHGEQKTGTVIRVNQKTVSIAIEGYDGWWNVSPQALEHI